MVYSTTIIFSELVEKPKTEKAKDEKPKAEKPKVDHNAHTTQDVTPSRLSEINSVDLTDSVRGKTRLRVRVYQTQGCFS